MACFPVSLERLFEHRGCCLLELSNSIFFSLSPTVSPSGYHEYSFAHETMGKRLPTILGKAVDDTIVTLNEQHDEEKIVDLSKCIERMQELMTDLSENATLRPIIDDGEGDIPYWNKVSTSTPLS